MASFPNTIFPATEEPEQAPNTAFAATTVNNWPPLMRPSQDFMAEKAPLAIPVSPANAPTNMNMGSTA